MDEGNVCAQEAVLIVHNIDMATSDRIIQTAFTLNPQHMLGYTGIKAICGLLWYYFAIGYDISGEFTFYNSEYFSCFPTLSPESHNYRQTLIF